MNSAAKYEKETIAFISVYLQKPSVQKQKTVTEKKHLFKYVQNE